MDFKTVFSIPFQAIGKAPGRVNLMGEHTDYNQGFVLPTILPQTTMVEMAIDKNNETRIEIFSTHYQEKITRSLDSQNQNNWTDYILACLQQLQQQGIQIPSLKIFIHSTIPIGAGLSSSAALEVAVLKAINSLLKLNLTDIKIAKLAQKAESLGVGMPCGIMDQMVCALGKNQSALFLDTQDLSWQHIPLPTDYSFAVVHSGKSHALVESGYQKRRQECEMAAQLLKVSSLREISIHNLKKLEQLPNLLSQRSTHVITENQRVLDSISALQENRMTDLGQLMNSSHLSQKEQFEVTIEETDFLWEKANFYGALGARQTGGGFGGSIVALVPKNMVNKWLNGITKDCPKAKPICFI